VTPKTSIWIVGAGTIATLFVVGAMVWPGFMGFVVQSGANVPSDDVYLDYAKGVAWAAILAASIFVWPVSLGDKLMVVLMWLAKCAVMLIAMLPYEEHYIGLDCWVYFVNAHSVGADFLWGAVKGGSDFIVSLCALYLRIGPDSYHAMKVTSGYVGLAAVYLLYRAAVALVRTEKRWMFWALGLYPSVLFWSSIMGKDPVVLFGIALHLWGLMRMVCYAQHKHLITVLLGIGLASAVRIWLGPILLLPALLLFALKIRHVGWRVMTVSLVVGLLAILAPATASRLDIDPTTDLFASTQSFTRGWDKANSALHPDVELTSLADLVLFTPQSVFAAYFRPLPGDLPQLFGAIAGLEDLILLILSACAVLKLRRRYWRNHIFLWAVALLITWGLAYSLVTYKDLGTAVRFRLQIMPVLLGMVWFLVSRPVILRSSAAGRSYA
jgi:hypothetical protein